MDISIVGTGRAGKAVAVFLSDLGLRVHYLIDLDLRRARETAKLVRGSIAAGEEALELLEGTVVISVPDDRIRNVFLELWKQNRKPDMFLHLSGMKDSSVFAEAENAGKAVASVHPNIAFGRGEDAPSVLQRTVFAIEGNDVALRAITGFFENKGLACFRIEKHQKVLYHAAAVLAVNFPVALAGCAMEIYRMIGVDNEMSHLLVSEYLKNAAQLVSSGLPEEVITGPAIRGDTETVKTETRALEDVDKSIAEVYEKLSSIIEKWR